MAGWEMLDVEEVGVSELAGLLVPMGEPCEVLTVPPWMGRESCWQVVCCWWHLSPKVEDIAGSSGMSDSREY